MKAGAAPDVTVAYAGGEPKFEKIPETQVARAVNTGNDIIQYGDKYYLVYEGMWYVASKPTGPWAATADVPAAVYEIPPSSPAYPVTQVIVQTTDSGQVQSSYSAGYASGMYVAFGVAYYGTGWYYPPYYYGGYYYPYYPTYGHGSWYNPNTGGYGSRSVYYGPYGGYSYNQGYNPKTGRASYVETAWDGDEWASSGGTYNPRTGISSQTDRYYSEDSNKMKMERSVQGPGGGEMDVKKTTDFDTGTRTTERQTDRRRQLGGHAPAPGRRRLHDFRRNRDRRRQERDDRWFARGRTGVDDDHRRGRRQRYSRPRAQPGRQRFPRGQLHRPGRRDGGHGNAPRRPPERHESGGQRRRQRDLRVRRTRASARPSRRAAAATSTPATTAMFTARRTTAGSSTATAAGPTSTPPSGRRAPRAACRATSSMARAPGRAGDGCAALRRLGQPGIPRNPRRLRRSQRGRNRAASGDVQHPATQPRRCGTQRRLPELRAAHDGAAVDGHEPRRQAAAAID